MPRTTRSQSTLFRWEGDERKDINWRIAPQAIRFQQGRKVSVVDTLGGYYKEVFYSTDPQYSGLLLPDLTLEGTSGVAYRRELKEMDWLRRHCSDRKRDGSPVDVFFFSNSSIGAYNGIERDEDFAWLVEITNFAWDDSASTFGEIKFSLRLKILRDLLWDTQREPFQATGQVPTLEELTRNVQGGTTQPVASGRSPQETPTNATATPP
jgi:hypothetical protein